MANALLRKICNRKLLFKLVDLPIYNNCASIYFIKVNHSSLAALNHGSNGQQLLAYKQFGAQFYANYSKDIKNANDDNDEKVKLSLYQRFKQMYKDYWYVLLPVHLVTSAAWFGSFYYMAKSGVDIVAVLESWNVSEKITNPLKDSSMGYIAVAYACYKIATPARYTVTLGGTTVSINYLKKWGYIKPVPSTERLKEIYQAKKENLIEHVKETKENIKLQSDRLKEKKETMIEDFDKSITQIKQLGDKIKQNEPIVAESKERKKKKMEKRRKN